MSHIYTKDPERPFGITRRIAELTMVLARNGYKFKTPKAVETAYKTLLFYETCKILRFSNIAANRYATKTV